MNKRIETISELVDAFGGPTEMARWAGTSQPCISNWLTRGYIPPSWHFRLLIEAGRRGLEVHPVVFDLSQEDYGLLVTSLSRETETYRVA